MFVGLSVNAQTDVGHQADTNVEHQADTDLGLQADETLEAPSEWTPARLPQLTPLGTYPSTLGYYPWTGSMGYGDWQLHQGMNLTFGASVFASFGKQAYHGVGFGQNLAMMYATPLSNRLTAAAGVYMNNLAWGGAAYRTAGLSALLNYQLSERLDAFMFGQKQLLTNMPLPMRLYDWSDVGDRIGVGLHYKVTPAFSFSATFSYGHAGNDIGK